MTQPTLYENFATLITEGFQNRSTKDGKLTVTSESLTFNSTTDQDYKVIIPHYLIQSSSVHIESNKTALEVYCKDFRRLVLEVSDTSLEVGKLQGILMSSAESYTKKKFSSGDYDSSSVESRIYASLKRQGYSSSSNLVRTILNTKRPFIIPSFLSDKEMNELSSFFEGGKFPSISWGCWNPSSEYYGTIIMRSGRPLTNLFETSELEDEPGSTITGTLDDSLQSKKASGSLFRRNIIFLDDLHMHINGQMFSNTNFSKSSPNIDISILSSLNGENRVGQTSTDSITSSTNSSKQQLPYPVRTFTVVDLGGKLNPISDFFKYYGNVQYMKVSDIEIEEKFDQLYTLCVCQKVWEMEMFVNTANTLGWYVLVVKFLSTAQQMSDATKSKGGLYLIESAGQGEEDSIIVALMMILCDRYYSTIDGFSQLLVDEFVFNRTDNDSKRVFSVIFLFLSCVYELMQQNMSSFEFEVDFLEFIISKFFETENLSCITMKEKYLSSNEFLDFIEKNRKSFVNSNYNPIFPVKVKDISNFDSKSLWYMYMLRHNPSIVENNAQIADLFKTQIPSSFVDLVDAVQFWIPSLHLLENQKIQSLSVTNGYLTSLSKELVNMTSLTSLTIERNFLKNIPSNITQLVNLQNLCLDHNILTPQNIEIISSITSIQSLSIAKNKVSMLPFQMNSLTNLTNLNISGNGLSHIPYYFFKSWSKLVTLSMSDNSLTILSDKFQDLKNLCVLNLQNNKLDYLPPSIFSCTQLESLNIAGNQFKLLPTEIGQLVNLKTLEIQSNLFTRLPSSIARLDQLEKFSAAKNKIKEIPPWFYRMTEIKYLDLSNNNMLRIGSLSHLNQLEYLDLSSNKIQVLPLTLGCLVNSLQELKINKNPIKGMTEDLVAMVNDSSKTKELLEYLNSQLQEMRSLNKTKVMVVGTAKTALIQALVKKIDYEATRFEQAHPSVQITAEKTKNSTNGSNPTPSSPRQMYGEGISIYRTKLYRQADKEKEKPKLGFQKIRIGKESQKTSSPAEPPVTMQLDIWDFAPDSNTSTTSKSLMTGYFTTHQLFLSAWAVYVIVCSANDPKAEKKIEFWLRSIKSRVHQPKVLIALSQIETLPRIQVLEQVSILSEHLSAKFGKQIPIHAVSAVNDEIVSQFQMALLTSVKSDLEVPNSYFLFESLLKEHSVELDCPIINRNELQREGALCNLTKYRDVLNCIRTLHKMGSILFFEEVPELSDLVLLDPQWLVHVMANFFMSAGSWIKDGVLDPSNLAHIWKQYPTSIHSKLLVLMEKFDVVVWIDGDVQNILKVISTQQSGATPSQNTYKFTSGKTKGSGALLVPALLPSIRPTELLLVQWPRIPPENINHIDRIYRFSFLPEGLFPRLVSRLLQKSRWIVSLWASGAIVTNESPTASATVFVEHHVSTTLSMEYKNQSDLRENELIVQVRSSSKQLCRDVFQDLISHLNVIASSWEELQWTRFTRAPFDLINPNVESPTLISIEEVEKAVAAGQTTLTIMQRGVNLVNIVPDLLVANFQGLHFNIDQVSLGRVLGEGGFALVYECTYGNQEYALKKMRFTLEDANKLAISSAIADFSREVITQSRLDHPNIVPIRGISIYPHAIFFELCRYGNLFDVIHNQYDIEISWSLRIKIATDVALALKFLHNQKPPIAHLDMKSPNVMIKSLDPNDPVCAMISDFGTSRTVTEDFRHRAVDNPVWLAPEIIEQQPFNEKVDTYAYGVIAWELLTREAFFGDVAFFSILQDRIIDGQRPKIPPECPDLYKNIIEKCWEQKAALRLQWDEVLDKLSKLKDESVKLDQLFKSNPTPIKKVSRGAEREDTERNYTHNSESLQSDSKKQSNKRSGGLLRSRSHSTTVAKKQVKKTGKEEREIYLAFQDIFRDTGKFNGFFNHFQKICPVKILEFCKALHDYRMKFSSSMLETPVIIAMAKNIYEEYLKSDSSPVYKELQNTKKDKLEQLEKQIATHVTNNTIPTIDLFDSTSRDLELKIATHYNSWYNEYRKTSTSKTKTPRIGKKKKKLPPSGLDMDIINASRSISASVSAQSPSSPPSSPSLIIQSEDEVSEDPKNWNTKTPNDKHRSIFLGRASEDSRSDLLANVVLPPTPPLPSNPPPTPTSSNTTSIAQPPTLIQSVSLPSILDLNDEQHHHVSITSKPSSPELNRTVSSSITTSETNVEEKTTLLKRRPNIASVSSAIKQMTLPIRASISSAKESTSPSSPPRSGFLSAIRESQTTPASPTSSPGPQFKVEQAQLVKEIAHLKFQRAVPNSNTTTARSALTPDPPSDINSNNN
eukprot:TRINITY_DN3014_c0_g1_i1.p1 TRINITY_DN3014_c0_g1~~TRINITY_DN3014_c0_g1_i1.p1  ORF type:complete len:2289 (+),score=389.78 TRINITY_DN3014_c0_g1_i1:90-6956(+)